MCWPQSPPQTEGSALRVPVVARAAIRSQGIIRYASTQLFYGYRWVLARAALAATDIFVCGSTWARDEWRRFGADAAALRTLAYPIDLDAFAETPPVGARRDCVTFLWLGRAVPRKRLDLFLAGFELLVRRRPEARARLVGNLMNDPFATRLLEPYENHPAISIEGAVEHARVKQLFTEVDVVVQPSQNENFGFSVAEALAAGRAVVLGPTNGTRDYTGEGGFEFADYRPELVADAMERAFAAVRAEGPNLSIRARASAREHFDIERITPAFAELCSEAVARGRARSRARNPTASSSA
jgi:glycosyltransferase involved in cell wall biosynthesis